MNDRGPRPLPNDPDREMVGGMFDLTNDEIEWWLSAGGEYQTGAAETMRADGSDWQRVVLLEWPARVNRQHGPDAERKVRLMIAPEDGIGLAEVLAHTSAWLLSLPT